MSIAISDQFLSNPIFIVKKTRPKYSKNNSSKVKITNPIVNGGSRQEQGVQLHP